jgi:crotonobetainyl-CoA:carnitine CoA-transferase CaiB-like acyl-CoA transferase
MTGGAVTSEGPLAGLRVIDLSPTRVGAQVTQTLADIGAEVVWVGAAWGQRASVAVLLSGAVPPCVAVSGDEPLTLALFNGGEADAGRLRPLP